MKKSMMKLFSAIVLSVGVLGAGVFIGKGLYSFRNASHIVTVKGMAERNVKSDLGVWEINYREIGDDLSLVNKQLEHDQALVADFLISHGFKNEELTVQSVRVEDRQANTYEQANAKTKLERYVVTSGIRVRSTHVDLIAKINALTGTLLQQGVAVAFDIGSLSPNPSYYFTRLDSLRPEMLADATHSARLVAEQFANDAGTHLGSISHASQGLFQLMSRDSMNADEGSSALSSIDKKIRLVTTIDYQLK